MQVVELVRSIPKEFLEGESWAMSKDLTKYVEEVLDKFCHDKSCRVLGNVYIALGHEYKSSAALGFLAFLTVLKKWSVRQGDPDWFGRKCLSLAIKGMDETGAYIIPVLRDPQDEVLEVIKVLDNTPVVPFLRKMEDRVHLFSLGACFLVGVLMYVEGEGQEKAFPA